MSYQHIFRVLPTVIKCIMMGSVTKGVVLNLLRRTASCFLESALKRIMSQVVSTIGMEPRLIKMSAMGGCGLVLAWMPVYCQCWHTGYLFNFAIQHSDTFPLVNSMQIVLWPPSHPPVLIMNFMLTWFYLQTLGIVKDPGLDKTKIIFSGTRYWIQRWAFDLFNDIRLRFGLDLLKERLIVCLAKVNLLECEPITTKNDPWNPRIKPSGKRNEKWNKTNSWLHKFK